MEKPSAPKFRFLNARVLAFVVGSAGLLLLLFGLSLFSGQAVNAQAPVAGTGPVQVVASYHNDVSPPLTEVPAWSTADVRRGAERDANANPKIPYRHRDGYDPVVQNWHVSEHGFTAPNIPIPIRNFDGSRLPRRGL